MGSPAIVSGLNTFQPISFAKERFGRLLMCNGLDRGYIWDGQSSAAVLLGIAAPTVAPGITASGGAGGATAGAYLTAYRYTDSSQPTAIPSSRSPTTSYTATALDAFIWTITAPTETRPTRVELFRTTAAQTTTMYQLQFSGVATQTYIGSSGTVSSCATSAGNCNFTMPLNHGLVVNAKFLMAGNSVAGYNTTHKVTAVTATTVKTDQAFSAAGGSATWTLTGFALDTATDATLITYSALPVLAANGTVNADRFTPPPDTKPFICQHQDRMWYAGTVKYTAGTISITQNTTTSTSTVTGVSTAWTAQMVGRYLYVNGGSKPYLITAYSSATSITISAFTDATVAGVTYCILPSASERNKLYFSFPDEPESVPTTNTITLQENTGDECEVTGLMKLNSGLFVLKERQMIRVQYVRQPQIDATPILAASRGAFNNRCWACYEDVAYLMDENGCYAFDGKSVEPIGEPIGDLFDRNTVDFANARKWSHVCVDSVKQVVMFYIGYMADSSTRPRHALCFDLRDQVWWTEDYIWEVGDSCSVSISGRLVQIIGAENELILKTNTGTTDIVTSATRGTATSGGNTTLSDTTAPFTAAMVDAPVGIISGTGAGQWRRIASRTTTQLTVSTAWTTNPDSTSVYVVGAIYYNYRTQLMEFPLTGNRNKRSLRLTYLPTTNNAEVDLRLYRNHFSSADNMRVAHNAGTGVTTTTGSPNIAMNLKLTQSANGNDVGFKQWMFGGLVDDLSQGDRYLAFELNGFGGQDQITFYHVDFEGLSE